MQVLGRPLGTVNLTDNMDDCRDGRNRPLRCSMLDELQAPPLPVPPSTLSSASSGTARNRADSLENQLGAFPNNVEIIAKMSVLRKAV